MPKPVSQVATSLIVCQLSTVHRTIAGENNSMRKNFFIDIVRQGFSKRQTSQSALV
jgi:hypothetical protein